MINWIFIGILVIILIIIIILHIGVRIIANWQKVGSKLEFSIIIQFLSRFTIYSLQYPSIDSNNENKKKYDDESIRDILGYVKNSWCLIMDFFKKFLSSLKVDKLENHLNFGLDSYVSTAEYVGYLWSIFVIPNSLFENAILSVEPNFNEAIIDFKGECNIKINLLKIIIPTITLLQDKNIRNIIKKTKKKVEHNGNSQ